MKSKKSFIIFEIIFIFTLLLVSMALGFTGAYYKTNRTGAGSIYFNKGLYYTVYNLSVDSTGTTVSNGNILYYTDGTSATTSADFKNISIGQTETYQIATPYIQAESRTIPFYVRAKLEYKFYTESDGSYTEIENATAIANLKTALFNNGIELEFDSTNWSKIVGDWHYYSDSSSNLKEINSSTTEIIKVFESTTASSGNYYSTLKTGSWGSLVGGPETTVDGTTYKLAKMDINLIIETIQVEGVELWGI